MHQPNFNMARALRSIRFWELRQRSFPSTCHVKNAAFLKVNMTRRLLIRFDKRESLKRRQNTDPTVAVIAAAVRHYERVKEAASRATTLPVVGE